jgi:hypothetical protein
MRIIKKGTQDYPLRYNKIKCDDDEEYSLFAASRPLIVDSNDLCFTGLLDQFENPLFKQAHEPIGFTPEGAMFLVLDFEPEVCDEKIKCKNCEHHGECIFEEEKILREKAEGDAKRDAKKLKRESKK